MLIARLQPDHIGAGAICKIRVFVKVSLGLLVEFLQVVERQITAFASAEVQFQFGDQHAKLRTPVTHVILPNNAVSAVL